MITAKDLGPISIFSKFTPIELERLAMEAGEIRVIAGDWLMREGELATFNILLDGQLSLHKNYLGLRQEMTQYGTYKSGDFFGEIPILLGCRTFIGMRADLNSRVARFDAQLLHRLIRDSEELNTQVREVMNFRLSRVCLFFTETPPTRVLIVGLRGQEYRDICHFLTLNRISYEWIGTDQPERIPLGMPCKGPAILVDGTIWLSEPLSVRCVAQALGIPTSPAKKNYDVVIVGGGPAGLAAAVYGASEGLNVLMVERSAAGGQAGSSARIENYLGFPDGISGDDMSEKALRQAERFGAEMVFTRTVTRINRLKDGSFRCQLDGGETFTSQTVILATGVNWRCFEADGIKRLRGHGIHYGAAKTEAPAVIGKHVYIVGGGNSAGQAAVFFADYACSVNILVRGEGLNQTMSQYLIDQILLKDNITVEPYTQVIAADGGVQLESITIVKHAGEAEENISIRKADTLFILIGATANTAWLPKELERDNQGFVCTGADVKDTSLYTDRQPFMLETTLPGFFCAGDVRHNSIKRVSSGVGEGSMAITFVHQYLASRAKTTIKIPKVTA